MVHVLGPAGGGEGGVLGDLGEGVGLHVLAAGRALLPGAVPLDEPLEGGVEAEFWVQARSARARLASSLR